MYYSSIFNFESYASSLLPIDFVENAPARQSSSQLGFALAYSRPSV